MNRLEKEKLTSKEPCQDNIPMVINMKEYNPPEAFKIRNLGKRTQISLGLFLVEFP